MLIYKSIVILSVIILCITFIFSVANITLYATKSQYNNPVDEIGLSLADYFMGAGVIGIMFIIIWVLTLFTPVKLKFIMILSFITGLFFLLWIILGAFVIFRGAVENIKNKEPAAIYALVLWSLSLLVVFIDFALKVILYYHSPKRREIYKSLTS